MKLYHGTNIDFDEIDLSVCLPYKDFGQGFYLTDIYDQARRMADRKCRRFGSPIIQVYEIDEMVLRDGSGCKVKSFNCPDLEWTEFIIKNRQIGDIPFKHNYDIVIGPVADDGVAYVLNRYLEGSFSMEDVVRELQFTHLNNQYYFGTQKAIKHLKRIK